MDKTDYIWFDGSLVKWDDAKVHVLTHALHYGTGVFESCRCYDTKEGPAIFRLKEHMQRLKRSAGFYSMKIPYSVQELCQATVDTVKANRLDECYIRPIAFFGYKELGVYPLNNPVDVAIAAWKWGAYLGEEGLRRGAKITVSKWRRISEDIMPPQSKATANYANSALAKMDAIKRGYDEAIMLNAKGTVAEGSGENLFIVKGKTVATTSDESGALRGITQDAVKTIAKGLGYNVRVGKITMRELLSADEVFLTGTAAEVTPIRQIDKKRYGGIGPVTQRIQTKFFDIVKGRDQKYRKWLTPVG
ncbi:MAG: branched-chain amino acid transaminase [Candidatus Altiarchaeota archaeon]